MNAATERLEFAPPPPPGFLRAFVLAVLAAERIVICAEDGGWLLARAAEGVRLVEVAQLFGWRRPPAGADLPGSAGCRVGQRYGALLAAMERAADLPLASLRGGPGL